MQMLERKKESSQLSKFVHFQREEKVRTFFDETGFTALPAGREQRVPLQSRHAVRKGPRDEDEWWQCATVHRIDHQLVANQTKGKSSSDFEKNINRIWGFSFKYKICLSMGFFFLFIACMFQPLRRLIFLKFLFHVFFKLDTWDTNRIEIGV